MQYEHQTCPHCGQSLSYELEIDKGTTEIVKGVARAIKEKGINSVHIAKEVLAKGYVTVNQRSNASRPKAHGLIAKVKGQPGNYSLTNKGLAFLKGEPVPRATIIQKATQHEPSHVIGHSDATITIAEIDRGWTEYWSANGYEIREGRVVTEPQIKTPQQTLV
jgi:hypothetical protein